MGGNDRHMCLRRRLHIKSRIQLTCKRHTRTTTRRRKVRNQEIQDKTELPVSPSTAGENNKEGEMERRSLSPSIARCSSFLHHRHLLLLPNFFPPSPPPSQDPGPNNPAIHHLLLLPLPAFAPAIIRSSSECLHRRRRRRHPLARTFACFKVQTVAQHKTHTHLCLLSFASLSFSCDPLPLIRSHAVERRQGTTARVTGTSVSPAATSLSHSRLPSHSLT